MSGVLSSLSKSRKFLLATVAGLAAVLGHYGLLPPEVIEAIVTWAGVLIATITLEDVAEKL